MENENFSTLELSFSFNWLLIRTPVAYNSVWETIVSIDGHPLHFFRQDVVEISCPPGRHEIEVKFVLHGLPFLHWLKAGCKKLSLEVPANQVIRLRYHGGITWAWGNASLRVVR